MNIKNLLGVMNQHYEKIKEGLGLAEILADSSEDEKDSFILRINAEKNAYAKKFKNQRSSKAEAISDLIPIISPHRKEVLLNTVFRDLPEQTSEKVSHGLGFSARAMRISQEKAFSDCKAFNEPAYRLHLRPGTAAQPTQSMMTKKTKSVRFRNQMGGTKYGSKFTSSVSKRMETLSRLNSGQNTQPTLESSEIRSP